MSALQLHQSQTRPHSLGLADELIAASYAHPSDKIIVAGANQLDLLIALLRRGFLDAACVSADHDLHATADAADILIAPALEVEGDLLRILDCLGGALRPGGMLVIRASSATSCTEQQLLATFLQFGFAAVERLPGRSHDGELWLARKQIKMMAKAA